MPLPPRQPDDLWLWGLVASLKQLGLSAREPHGTNTHEPGELRLLAPGGGAEVVIENGPEASGADRFREAIANAADHAATIDGFTAQLTELYDTIDLLYTIGRAHRDLAKPQAFIELVLSRLQKTLCFTYFAIKFDRGACNAPTLSSLLLLEGTPPVDAETLTASIVQCAAPDSAEGWAVRPSLPGLVHDGNCQVLVQAIRCRGRDVGVLVAGQKTGLDPAVSSYDIQLVHAAAGHIESFCDNVSFFEDQRALFIGTVRALTAAIDAKYPYTFGHSERVSMVAGQIAEAMGLSVDEVETIRLAGLVHDVGKIGVPEAVLCKAGALTDEEFAAIKKHPVIGERILNGIPQLADVLPGVMHHHERWDGRGYPHRLEGENIPLSARIISVADAFDAMSSSRSYREGMPREKVFSIIATSAGSQLDARVVEAFRRIDFTQYDRAIGRNATSTRQAA